MDELNKPAAIGKVSKILNNLEAGAEGNAECLPDHAVNGDRGQLAVGVGTKARQPL